MPLTLFRLPQTYAVARLAPDAPIPAWARGALVSITRTTDELSILAPATAVPADLVAERDWRVFGAGPGQAQLHASGQGIVDGDGDDGVDADESIGSAQWTVFENAATDSAALRPGRCRGPPKFVRLPLSPASQTATTADQATGCQT